MSPEREREAQKELRKVWFAVFTSSLAMMSVLPHLPRYLEERFELSGDEWAIFSGLVFGAAPLAAAFAGPLWGALGDRFGRKWNLLRAQLAILGFLTLVPFINGIWWLVLMRFVQGLCAGWVAPAFSLATAPWPAERRGFVLGRLQIGMTLGLLIGPLLGAEVLARLGRQSPFWLGSGLAVVGLLTTLRVREDRATLKDGKGGGPKGRLLDGFRLVARSRVLALFLLAMCIGRLGIALVEPQLAIFVREELGPLSLIVRESQEDAIDRTIALLSTVLAIGVLFTGATWSRLGDRLRPVRVLSAAGLVIGCSLLAMSLVETSAGLLSLRAVYAIGFAGLLPLSYAAISRITPVESIGAAYALNQSAVQLALGLGFALGGFLESHVEIRTLLLIAGGIGLVAYGVLPLLRKMQRKPGESGMR
jgi:DHA1 family multidrug resistance protein-like MFS transporter